jgi:DnaJ-domain-containing protein 1
MSTELLAKIMQNADRDTSLVEQSPRQSLEEDRSPDESTGQNDPAKMLETLKELLRRRRDEQSI